MSTTTQRSTFVTSHRLVQAFVLGALMLPAARAFPSDVLQSTGWNRHASRLDKRIDRVNGWPLAGAWQNPVIEHMIQVCTGTAPTLNCAERDLYEFGVYTGRYMRMLVVELARRGVPYRKFFGFDSFQGLPEEANTTRTRLSKNVWKPGAFNAADIFQVHSATELELKLKRFINDSRVEFVRGFYNESLTPQLAEERSMRPALYVEIDCDLYISSVQALDWMLANKLIVKGTVLGYDDLITGGEGGERRAHAEMVAKYGLKLRKLRQYIFVVEAVGLPG